MSTMVKQIDDSQMSQTRRAAGRAPRVTMRAMAKQEQTVPHHWWRSSSLEGEICRVLLLD